MDDELAKSNNTQKMFEKITKQEFLSRLNGCYELRAVELYNVNDFDEHQALAHFEIKHAGKIGGHIVVHDDFGLTQFVIYLWRG